MIRLRSLVFNVALFGSLSVFLLGAWVLLPFSREAMRFAIRRLTFFFRWQMKAILGLDYEFRGLENLPPAPAILASKHQSAWDTIAFIWLAPFPVYVLKKELLSIPFWGWCAGHCGHVAVDRRGGAAALRKMVKDSLAAVADGRYVVIFPEGTRVAPGAKRPYHPGVAALYAAAPCPVVPVALNSGVFWGRRRFIKRPGRVILEFLPAIAPGLNRQQFTRELETRIEAATERLVAEAETSSNADGADRQ